MTERRCPGCEATVPLSHFYCYSGRIFATCKACAYGAQKKRIELRDGGCRARPPLVFRFWSKVRRGSASECWPFTGSCDPKGYGRFHHLGNGRLAHRVAWELVNGAPPPGLQACHKCDNPPCCNPAHLFLGTDAENKSDMRSKGRKGGRKRIDPDDERSVRIVSILGLRANENAVLHGMSCYLVSRILRVA